MNCKNPNINNPKLDGRILYINYDSPEPSGGVKVIYSHVSHLVKNGYPAFVVHNQADFRLPWLDCDVPILYAGNNLQILPNDIVVIPEDHKTALKAFRNIQAKKYVFCQNHFYVFKGLQNGDTWQDYGISNVFCCSDIISKFVRSVFDYGEVPVIHNAIHLDLFKPRKKKLQIAYMPRKTPGELDFIRNLFDRLYKQYRQVPWICIDKVNEAKVAEIMSESAIFLSTSIYEGFGLPPIEAMACGCIVVGFHGDGGLEYASRVNGFWCEGGNIIECARTLGHVVSLIDNKDKIVDKIKNQALKKAGEYTFDRQKNELLDFWSKIYK
ncbi:MAG: glycosyltransferase [Candidatus Scalindua rubra]|uniref:Glycosyltransferase n=1 Tax=Candidatus Scalindua rubra TaxID=1872076 RepID=A0A1E3XE30_9BACT|nr:MAG: glycosyltransferase [Candidatus Scalindua rubra]